MTEKGGSSRGCILIGWELGAGMGHVGLLRPLAQALRNQGYRVVMALRELAQAQLLLKNTGLELLQAPLWNVLPDDPKVDLRTLADVFYAVGVSDAARLRRQALGWDQLVRTIDPDLIIGEYSPGLALAALGARPYITVGSGFTVLPPIQPAPPFRCWEKATPPQSVAHESAIMDAVTATRLSLGLAPLGCLAELFGGNYVGVCTYPGLDNYRSYRKKQALGPLCFAPPGAQGRSSEPKLRRGVFAYLSGLAVDFETIVAGLSQAAVPVQAHVRDLQPGQEALLRSKGVAFHSAPRDLQAELPGFAAIVHHGGLSTTHVAIEAATPQLILPNQTEQVITGQRVVDLKIGLGLSRSQRSEESIEKALRNLVVNPVFRQGAQRLCTEVRHHAGPSALSLLLGACDALVHAA